MIKQKILEVVRMSNFKNFFKGFWKDEEGLQTLEILLIIAVIVVIALSFRQQITSWVENLVNFGNDQVEQFTE